ncbi:uncharacterized protein STEHIDRAFT_162710 [Stereum hirsutum FP-91666 SS1]|uniref:Uncharacterized protein n=1 Tax=Stereum hirsutum (strain FP-91666) TaxID=721885 RepID=R7RZE3_STEHR|nr:uncharacterized protein STEHIDRAFT_162710 [Stereum hirsutum FP-91666 SS1]EIM80290.1 hypothetical protein STEHIDRAFT_162710 [Stereum hirsutum FP-91666 SS1]
MTSINHTVSGHLFGDLQIYDTDVPALSNNSVRGPFPESAQTHLSPNLDSMERYLYIEKRRQKSMTPLHLALPSRSVSRSPHVREGAHPVHRPQSPNSGMLPSYSTSLFNPAPGTGLYTYPALYLPPNPRAQSEDELYSRDTPCDTSSHLPLPRQRRNTYSGYTPKRHSVMPPPMARSQSPSSSSMEHQEDCGGFVHRELVRALVGSGEVQNDSETFLFGMASGDGNRAYDEPTMVNRFAQDLAQQEHSAQSQDAQAYEDDFGKRKDFRCRKSSGIFVSREQLGYPPNKDFAGVQTDAVDGESGSISPSDPTGLNSPIPSRINDISGSIGNSGVAPNSFEEAGLAPAVSSTDESNGHTASSAGNMHGTNIPHGLPNDVPNMRTRGSAKSSSPAAPAAPPALPTRSRRKVKQHDGKKKEKRRDGDKKEKQKDGEKKAKQQDGEKISFRGRCAPRHKSGDIWVMGTMSGHTIDNPLQKGVKAWQDPLLMDEWNGEKAKRVPKLALFEEIVKLSVDSPVGSGEGKKRGRDDDDDVGDVAPAPKKARMARASRGNAKGSGSKVSLSGTSTGAVTLPQEQIETSGSAAGGEGPSTGADHIFSLGPREG